MGNKSLQGVTLYSKHAVTSNERNRLIYIAEMAVDGRKYRRSFSLYKYGKQQAYNRAKLARKTFEYIEGITTKIELFTTMKTTSQHFVNATTTLKIPPKQLEALEEVSKYMNQYTLLDTTGEIFVLTSQHLEILHYKDLLHLINHNLDYLKTHHIPFAQYEKWNLLLTSYARVLGIKSNL